MDISDLQEQIAALYLRLNGYFVSGFIIHAPEGEVNEKGEHRSARGEIDALAVRFPYNNEPEREVKQSDYLRVSNTHIDILICEVKGGNESLQFNDGLRNNRDRVLSVLRWIGILDENNIEKIIDHVIEILSAEYPNSPDKFREYYIANTNYRIRTVFFAPDRSAPTQPNQQRYIYGDEILRFIWKCLRSEKNRPLCQVCYDFGLWSTYEQIVRYFKCKERNDSGIMKDLYDYFKLEK